MYKKVWLQVFVAIGV